MTKVLLACPHKGCPRSKKIDFDPDTMPKNTAVVVTECDWHVGDTGWEEYFDKKYKQLDPMPAKYHN